MSSLLRVASEEVAKVKPSKGSITDTITESGTWGFLKEVFEVASKHPTLLGITLVTAGVFVKGTRINAFSQQVTNVQIDPDTEALLTQILPPGTKFTAQPIATTPPPSMNPYGGMATQSPPTYYLYSGPWPLQDIPNADMDLVDINQFSNLLNNVLNQITGGLIGGGGSSGGGGLEGLVIDYAQIFFDLYPFGGTSSLIINQALGQTRKQIQTGKPYYFTLGDALIIGGLILVFEPLIAAGISMIPKV